MSRNLRDVTHVDSVAQWIARRTSNGVCGCYSEAVGSSPTGVEQFWAFLVD